MSLGSIFAKLGTYALKNIGGSIGGIGGGILSSISRNAGTKIGNYLEQTLFHTLFNQETHTNRFVNQKNEFHIHKAEYGKPIPLIFGQMRIKGQIIWIDKIHTKLNSTVTKKYLKNKYLTINQEATDFEYYANFAMALCEGEVTDIGRIWYNNQLIDISQYKFRLYKGNEEQLPDPLINKLSGGKATAYRDIAYIVFENLPLIDFNNTIPNLSFEIIRKSNLKQKLSVEDLVESIIMIPGSGEYVYDTLVQTKSILFEGSGATINTKKINSHNHYNIANSIHSLNQLKTTCGNVKWVSPVICWFANNLDAKNCTIKPAVEFKDKNARYSEEWIVGEYNRHTAMEITKDEKGSPVYGGTVNDASIIRYLQELKKRGLKIMFYPMFLLDVAGKPWRGHVTTSAEHVSDFFQKKHGYNDFILHYAKLTKDYIDSFVIGSELIGLTKIRDQNKFPAVDELVKLAKKVKQILGRNILVTYAADWSEYHHTAGGWFNLDKLWGSPDIDFIGIDAYFPVTNNLSADNSDITVESIKKGFETGEGYNYYIDYKNNSKHRLSRKYAWKNIKYWWENIHRNPNGKITDWKPRSKPIWFTEFGFPSVNNATNQPNVFFDPKCSDGGVPRYSNGTTDCNIQRKAIRAFIEYWKTQEYIEQMFLWTWDARPYPAWPHMSFWSDGNLWEKGHWINDKFGTNSLASILLEISDRCSIDINNIDTNTIEEKVDGFILNSQITGINAINILRSSYFFDICANNKKIITFQKRAAKPQVTINHQSCIKFSDNSFVQEIDIPKKITLSAINLYFIDYYDNYNSSYIYINNENNSYTNTALVKFPIVFTKSEAQNIGDLMLKNAAIEDKIIKLTVDNTAFSLHPTDFITLEHKDHQYSIRIINTEIKLDKLIIIGIVDTRQYYFAATSKKQLKLYDDYNINRDLIILDLPFTLSENITTPFLAVYLRNNSSSMLSARLDIEDKDDWNRITTINPSNAMGKLVEFDISPTANIFMIDNISSFLIEGEDLDRYSDNDFQYAMIGKELIQFQKLEKIRHKLYKISKIIRGTMGTEHYINEHNINEDFVIINHGMNIISISDALKNQKIYFKSETIKKSIIYQNNANSSLEQYITEQEIINNELHLKWITRTKKSHDWSYIEDKSKIRFLISIIDSENKYQYQTNDIQIKIDVSNLNLSDNYKTIVNLNSL